MAEELTIELWGRVSRILDELLELDLDRRHDLMTRIRAEDPNLLWWTRALLVAASGAGDFMEPSAVPGARELLIRILATAGPPLPASACSPRDGPVEPVDIGRILDGSGRGEP